MLAFRDNLTLMSHQILPGQTAGCVLRSAVPDLRLGPHSNLRTAHHRILLASITTSILASHRATILASVATTANHARGSRRRIRGFRDILKITHNFVHFILRDNKIRELQT